MATSLSLSNFISFFFPSTPPAPPKVAPTQVSSGPSSSSPTQFQSQSLKPRDGLSPIAGNEDHSSSDLSSVICPSMAYSNTLYCDWNPYNRSRPGYDDESDDDYDDDDDMELTPEEKEWRLIQFQRDVMRAGILQEYRRRMFHEDPREKKKRKAREARELARRLRRGRRPYQERDDAAKEAEKSKDDDSDLDDDVPWEENPSEDMA